MYTKHYTVDGQEHWETYQSWYDVLWEGWAVGVAWTIIGVVSLVAAPFVAAYSYFHPFCTGNGGRRIVDFADKKTVEMKDRYRKEQCDLCGRQDVPLWDENIYPPDLTFQWCAECAKNETACNAKIQEAVAEYYKCSQE